jgi:hypothetical protein
MFRRLLFLNLVLLAFIALGAFRLRSDIQSFSAEHRIDRIQPESDKPLPKPAGQATASAKQDWADIAAHDPFSFDRNDVPIIATTPVAQQPKKPKPLLFGTMLLGKDFMALLAPSDGTSRSGRPVHVGETFEGWTVLEIQEKTVTVQSEQVKESLIINDPTAQQVVRTYEKTGGTAPAGPLLTVGATAPPPAPAAPISNPQSPAPTTASPTGNRRVVQTPFGPKIMDDPQ